MPEARPIILCNDVLADSDTGNVHLIGIFNAIRPHSHPAFPHRHPEFCVFLQLTDAQGEIAASVRIVESALQRVVYQGRPHPIHFDRRTSVVRAVIRVRHGEFPRPGVYWVEFYSDGKFVADHPLHLLESAEEATP